MPRQRPRRRRRRPPAPQPATPTSDAQVEPADPPRRRRMPSAGVVTALGLGIWLGWTFSGVGGIVEQIALWVGVIAAGLGGGRLFRRSLQSRWDRRR